jgi:hypothetical protein
MAEIIDITRRLSWKRVADIIAKGGQIVCHPSDRELFKEFNDAMVVTSNVMPQGKPYAVNFEEMRKAMMMALQPESMVIGIDWGKA